MENENNIEKKTVEEPEEVTDLIEGPKGRIFGVRGPVVDVRFLKVEDIPALYDVIETQNFEGRRVVLQVAEHLGGNDVRCISLSDTLFLQLNQVAINTRKPVQVQTGDELYGRIINVFGQPIDQLGPLAKSPMRVIRRPARQDPFNIRSKFGEKAQVLVTGIKFIDMLFPVTKGSKTGILGGAGCGKSVVILEMINNIVKHHDGCCVFTGIGERIREGNDLFHELAEAKLLDKVKLVFGQMNEPPGARFECVNTGITLAETLAEENKDVLLFMDNVFRFVQGGQEISTLLGRVPGESGYQPTLASEVNGVEERIRSIPGGASVTSYQAVYVPADDMTDPAVVAIFSCLDSVLTLSRDLAQKGFYPAIDPLTSSCSNLDPRIVGQKHYDISQKMIMIFAKYKSLQRIVQVVGLEEIPKEDQIDYKRGEKLVNFMTQPFQTAEAFTGKKGMFIPTEDSIEDCEKILNGHYDNAKASEFYMINRAP